MSSWIAIKKMIQRIDLGLCTIGMLLLIPMMLMTAGDVVGRTLWRTPIPGTVELSSYMQAVFILLGVAYTHQTKGHVRVSVLTSRLPKRAALLLDIITTLLSLFIIAVLFWQGVVGGLEAKSVSDMLRIPQWPFRLLVALAAFFLWLELLIDLAALTGRLLER